MDLSNLTPKVIVLILVLDEKEERLLESRIETLENAAALVNMLNAKETGQNDKAKNA